MKKIIALILCIIPLYGFAQNIEAYGNLKGDFSYNQYDKDAVFYQPCSGDYYISNYLLLNTEINLANLLYTSGHFDFDVKINELIASSSNDPIQNIEFQLNQAFISVQFSDWLFFSLGKKRIVWGVAFVNNPSDFINPPKDPFNPEVEKRGVYCTDLELFTEWFSLHQVVVVYDNLEYFGYGTKLSTSSLIPLTDLNLVFYYSENNKLNLGFSIDTMPFFEIPIFEDLAFHGEMGFSQVSDTYVVNPWPVLERRPQRDDFYKNFIIGLRYTFPVTDTMLIAEYYYLDDGYTKEELSDLITTGYIYDPNVQVDPGSMVRHNLFISLLQPRLSINYNTFTDTLLLSAAMLLNLLDASMLISGKIESGIIENCIFALEVGFFIGEENTE